MVTRGKNFPALLCIIAVCLLAAAPRAIATGGPQVTIVTDQAEAALAILGLREQGESVSAETWERLWSTEGAGESLATWSPEFLEQLRSR